jgi:hypothetical protein
VEQPTPLGEITAVILVVVRGAATERVVAIKRRVQDGTLGSVIDPITRRNRQKRRSR